MGRDRYPTKITSTRTYMSAPPFSKGGKIATPPEGPVASNDAKTQQFTSTCTDIRKYMTFKVVKQLNLIGAKKTFTKPNWRNEKNYENKLQPMYGGTLNNPQKSK